MRLQVAVSGNHLGAILLILPSCTQNTRRTAHMTHETRSTRGGGYVSDVAMRLGENRCNTEVSVSVRGCVTQRAEGAHSPHKQSGAPRSQRARHPKNHPQQQSPMTQVHPSKPDSTTPPLPPQPRQHRTGLAEADWAAPHLPSKWPSFSAMMGASDWARRAARPLPSRRRHGRSAPTRSVPPRSAGRRCPGIVDGVERKGGWGGGGGRCCGGQRAGCPCWWRSASGHGTAKASGTPHSSRGHYRGPANSHPDDRPAQAIALGRRRPKPRGRARGGHRRAAPPPPPSVAAPRHLAGATADRDPEAENGPSDTEGSCGAGGRIPHRWWTDPPQAGGQERAKR